VEVATISLSNVFSKDLAKIIEYCKKETLERSPRILKLDL